jgi:ferredoxin
MLRKIRISLATIFLLGLTFLFLDFTGTAHKWLGWMAKTQALEAVLALNVVVILALVVLTLVFGRIYCSVICPLGIVQDIFGWMGKKAKKNRYRYSKEMKWLRYVMLAVMIIALLAGIGSVYQLLAPYSAFGRIMSSLFQPLYMLGNNVLAGIAERADSYTFYSVDVWLKSLPVLIIAIVTLVALAVLAWRGGRTYCNTICPVGTALSFLARFSLLKIYIDTDKCKNCSICAKNCKASCIDFKTHTIDYSRCVVCGDCITKCNSKALRYGNVHLHSKATAPTDASKRSFLLASALATTALAQKKLVDGGLAPITAKQAPGRVTPLTPPGSLSVKNMAQHCTGCQLCVTKCPNNVLRPSTDLMSLMQPVMSYERGYCRPECTLCSEVCPAGAIKPIDKAEKSTIQIGHAIVVASQCISAQGKDECGNCERHCPTGAIEMVPSDPDDDMSPYVPAINESACIGCGACEYVCPVRPLSAIHVEGHEVHRKI